MIQLSKEECCGCGTCFQVCPVGCIGMKYDEEGFLYPQIDASQCVRCWKCEQCCPVLNKKKLNKDVFLETYAAYSKDDEIRMNSSSGGIFSLIANRIFDLDGVVFGAAFDESNQVVHLSIEKREDLWKLRGAKYVQSDVQDTYKQARKYLEQGRWVLYTGTPCQISGLYSYLKKRYDKLVTQDIICHGTMSTVIWNYYLLYIENKKGSPIKKISFRDKTYSWNQYAMALEFENGDKYVRRVGQDLLLKAYSSNLCLRPACYDCKFKGIHREADITLADYWNIQKINEDIEADKGVSLVLLHSSKGKSLFREIIDEMIYESGDFNQALNYNMSMVVSPNIPKERNAFMMSVIGGTEIEKVILKYCRDRKLLGLFKCIKVELIRKFIK